MPMAPTSRTAITEVSTLSSPPPGGNSGSNIIFESSSAGAGAVVVVPPPEAEAIIESLTAAPLPRIGSDDFMQRYCVDLERLALQAHLSASLTASSSSSSPSSSNVSSALLSSATAAFGHEYIVESILVEGRVEALVRTLLAIEIWRSRVLFPDGVDRERGDAGNGNRNGNGNGNGNDLDLGSDNDEEKENVKEKEGVAIDIVIECNGGVFDADDEGKVERGKEEEEEKPKDAAATATAGSTGNSNAAPPSTSSSPKGLAPLLAENKNSLRTAFILHAETTIVGLLSLIFYRREAFDDLSSEVAIALVDYTARCMTSLAVPVEANPAVRRQKHPGSATELADRIRTRTTLDEIFDSVLDARYKTCVMAVSLARYLCEHIDALPLSARSRILETHDFPVMIVPLIEEPPWTRRRTVTRKGGDGGSSSLVVWEKYIDGNWTEVKPDELLRVTKCEAQPWLLLFHLLCTPSCREAYGLNTFRKEQISRLRKFLNGVMTDQIPILADVMRYMDELSIMNVPETASTGHGTALLMQQVDSLREDIMAGASRISSDWDVVAREQFDTIFSKVKDSTDQTLRLISDVYGESGYESVLASTAPSLDLPLSSMPISEVVISFVTGGGSGEPIHCFKLDLCDESLSTVVESPQGKFRRSKCTVALLDGPNASAADVPPDAKVVAKVYFDGFDHTPLVLEVKSLDLPMTTVDVKAKKEWRQAGRLEDRLVVQLGFKVLPGEDVEGETSTTISSPKWRLNQAFVSQPASSD